MIECGKAASPWSILAATLCHIPRLEKLVDALSFDPTCRGILEEWLDTHKYKGEEIHFSRLRDTKRAETMHIHDPLYELPAITSALGPLLPGLLKRLLLPSFRLLLFVPPGAQTYRAAAIAFALGEMASSAFRDSKPDDDNAASQRIRIKGLIGLYDIGLLQDEYHGIGSPSWIAWTTDKVLLDKCQLYDAILDLSPMSASTTDSDLFISPPAPPKLLCTERSTTSTSHRPSFVLRYQTWTTTEFAVFRGLDELASKKAVLPKKRSKKIDLDDARSDSSAIDTSPLTQLSRQRIASTFLAFLRYWLSNLRILPSSWRLNIRESYGYVPLGIRSDGGIQASIMLLPDDEEEGEEDSEDGSQSGNHMRETHLSLPSGSQINGGGRRSFSRQQEEVIEDEEEVDENDPILAAVGATRSSLRHRSSRTRSHSSASQSGIRSVAKVMEHQTQENDCEGHNAGDGTAAVGLKEAQDSIRLAICIHQVWSRWVQELMEGIRDLIRDEIGESDETRSLDDDRAPLRDNNQAIKIDSYALAPLRLSVVNNIDVRLIRSIASTLTDQEVDVQVSWWSSATSFWS